MIYDYLEFKPNIHEDAWVSKQAHVSGQSILKEGANVWPMAVMRGDVNTLEVGRYSNIQDGAVVHATHASEMTGDGSPTKVGDYVTVGHNAILHGCTIEDECLVGMGATVLDGAVIEKHTLIGANALVPPGKHLESGYLWVGSPVKKARPLSDKEKAFFKYSAEHYYKLAKNHQASES